MGDECFFALVKVLQRILFCSRCTGIWRLRKSDTPGKGSSIADKVSVRVGESCTKQHLKRTQQVRTSCHELLLGFIQSTNSREGGSINKTVVTVLGFSLPVPKVARKPVVVHSRQEACCRCSIIDLHAAPTEELYLVCVAKPLLGHHCLPEKGPDHLCIALGARGLVGDLSITILHRALPK